MSEIDNELHKIAITAVIYKPDRTYLVTKRASHEDHFPGKWTVPGGKLSTDDYINTPLTHKNQWYYALTNTLKREVLEEVGLEIGKPEYLLDLIFIKGGKTPVLVLSYFAEYIGGEVKLNEDATKFAWISADEIHKYDLIEGIDHEIRLVDEILKNR